MGSNITSENVQEVLGTTTFLTDTSVIESKTNEIDYIDRNLLDTVRQDGNNSIIDFLRKPIDFVSGTLKATDSVNVNVLKFMMPSTMFNLTIYADKLASVPYLRADMVFTLNVNASRFTQGRYLLCFLPSPGPSPTDLQQRTWYNLHAIALNQKTQLPHVEIDLATQTTAQLVVPYTYMKTHYNTSPAASNYTNAGLLFLTPYSPLVAGSGPTEVPFTLWCNFDNVELNGTYVQSGIIVKKKKNFNNNNKDVIDDEVTNEFRPISGILNAVSSFTSTLSGVPLLSPYTAPLSWATSILAKTAHSFGFSKPLIGSPMGRMSRRIQPYGANSDGQNDSCSLANSKNNYVKTHTGVGSTKMDEMSIEFVKRQYAYHRTFQFSPTDVRGSKLLTLEHSPSKYFNIVGSSIFSDAPVAFLGRLFAYYRGSFKYRFKMVKTEFHSGRLMFAYLPFDADNLFLDPNPNMIASSTLYRTVVDIRETSEFEICVPYIVPSIYLPVSRTAGYLYVYVLDALVSPSTVNPSISIIVEVAGGDDLEYAVPVSESYGTVLMTTNIQSGYNVYPCQDYETKELDLLPAMTSIGERITSLRQIMKRMDLPVRRALSSPFANNDFFVRPFVNYSPIMSTDATPLYVEGDWIQDSIGFISSCYVFSTGSIHVHFFPDNANNNSLYALSLSTAPPGATLLNNNGYIGNPTAAGLPTCVSSTSVEGYISVHVPCYNRFVARSNVSSFIPPAAAGWTNLVDADSKGANLLYVKIGRASRLVTSKDTYNYARTAGDDYSCSMWVSTPTFRQQTTPSV